MIEVHSLVYTYPGNDRATLHGLDFSIGSGEIFGFLGPSGAGKSTTQKILIGLLTGFRGKILVDGADLATIGSSYYERVGVSFETPNLFSKLTGLENLRFFASLYAGETERPERLLELVGLGAKGNVPAGQYSKGMKARLSVARSLLNKPRILFLDEPTSGLDPSNARRMKDLILQERAAGTTVFLTTHNMTVADELCDRVALIVDGQISVIDSPRELKIRHGRKVVRVEYAGGVGTECAEFPFESIGENREFLELLRREEIETIHSLEATLEDIFIDVTGRSLTEPGEGNGA